MASHSMTDDELHDLVKKAYYAVVANDPQLRDMQSALDALCIVVKQQLQKKGWQFTETEDTPDYDFIEAIVDQMLKEDEE